MTESPAAPGPAAATPMAPVAPTPNAAASGILVQFLLIPSLLAVVSLGVIGLFGLLAAAGTRSPEECVRAIAAGNRRERWQAAYALAQSLAERTPGTADPASDGKLAESLGSLYRELGRSAATGADDEAGLTQRYLAAAMGHLAHPAAAEALREGARQGTPETRIYAIVALGRLGLPETVPDLVALLAEKDGDVRKTAAYVLGQVAPAGDASARAALRSLLTDPVEDVTWNAALALTARGDASGEAIVARLLDPAFLRGQTAMAERQRVLVRCTAVRAARGLPGSSLTPRVAALAVDDPDEAVRREARETMQAIGAAAPAAGQGA